MLSKMTSNRSWCRSLGPSSTLLHHCRTEISSPHTSSLTTILLYPSCCSTQSFESLSWTCFWVNYILYETMQCHPTVSTAFQYLCSEKSALGKKVGLPIFRLLHRLSCASFGRALNWCNLFQTYQWAALHTQPSENEPKTLFPLYMKSVLPASITKSHKPANTYVLFCIYNAIHQPDNLFFKMM